MSRNYHEESDISIRAGDARKKLDPLVLNFNALARIFHEPMLGEVKRLQVLRGAIFGLPLRRFEGICEFCRHRPQTPG